MKGATRTRAMTLVSFPFWHMLCKKGTNVSCAYPINMRKSTFHNRLYPIVCMHVCLFLCKQRTSDIWTQPNCGPEALTLTAVPFPTSLMLRTEAGSGAMGLRLISSTGMEVLRNN